MRAVLPKDPTAFVARAERATNAADADWPMTIYAPTVRLELFGDGRLRKTLVSASGDSLVNTWEGTLFGSRHTTRGAEIWHFDETGHVVHNVLYQSLDAQSPRHPMTAMRALLQPRLALTFLTARRRHRARPRSAR